MQAKRSTLRFRQAEDISTDRHRHPIHHRSKTAAMIVVQQRKQIAFRLIITIILTITGRQLLVCLVQVHKKLQ